MSSSAEDAAIKEAAAGVAVAHMSGSDRGMKEKCCDLLHAILWGQVLHTPLSLHGLCHSASRGDWLLLQEGAKHLNLKITIVLGTEAIFLAAVLIDFMCGGALKQHGIQPRNFPMGLIGIFFAPFLHRNIFHLLVNALPFAILSMLVLVNTVRACRWCARSLTWLGCGERTAT